MVFSKLFIILYLVKSKLLTVTTAQWRFYDFSKGVQFKKMRLNFFGLTKNRDCAPKKPIVFSQKSRPKGKAIAQITQKIQNGGHRPILPAVNMLLQQP